MRIGIPMSFAILAVLWIPAYAADPDAEPDETDSPSSARPALRVHLDPETGELLDAPSQPWQEWSAALRLPAPDYAGFQVQEIPGIGTYVHLGDDFQMISWTRIDADGQMVHECDGASVSPVRSPEPQR